MAKLGRPRRLTAEQAADAYRRWLLYKANQPKRIAADLGISVATLRVYTLGYHLRRAVSKAAFRARKKDERSAA